MSIFLTDFEVGFQLKRPDEGHIAGKHIFLFLARADEVVKRPIFVLDKTPRNVQ